MKGLRGREGCGANTPPHVFISGWKWSSPHWSATQFSNPVPQDTGLGYPKAPAAGCALPPVQGPPRRSSRARPTSAPPCGEGRSVQEFTRWPGWRQRDKASGFHPFIPFRLALQRRLPAPGSSSSPKPAPERPRWTATEAQPNDGNKQIGKGIPEGHSPDGGFEGPRDEMDGLPDGSAWVAFWFCFVGGRGKRRLLPEWRLLDSR